MRANEVENSSRVGHIAGIDVMAQAQPVFPVQNIAEAYLAQVVPALFVVPALCQLIARVVLAI